MSRDSRIPNIGNPFTHILKLSRYFTNLIERTPEFISKTRQSAEAFIKNVRQAAIIIQPFIQENKTQVRNTVVLNILLPVASGFIRNSAHNRSPDIDLRNFGAPVCNSDNTYQVISNIATILLPMMLLSIRLSNNSTIINNSIENIRRDLVEDVFENNRTLELIRYSNKSKNLPSVSSIANIDTARFSNSIAPMALSSLGATAELISMYYTSLNLVGNTWSNRVFTTGIGASCFGVFLSNLNNVRSKQYNQLDREFSGRVEHNIGQANSVATLGIADSENKFLTDSSRERELIHNSRRSLTNFTGMYNTFIWFCAPDILSNIMRSNPGILSSKNIEEFTRTAIHIFPLFRDIVAPWQDVTPMTDAIKNIGQLKESIADVRDYMSNPHLKILYNPEEKEIKFTDFRYAVPRNDPEITQRFNTAENLTAKVNIILERDNLCPLREANLSLEPGRVYRVVGESGIGKSVFFAAVNGLIPYTSGTVVMPCKEEEKYNMSQKSFASYNSTLLDVITAKMANKPTEAEIKDIHGFMEDLGVDHLISRLNEKQKDWTEDGGISGGEFQRLSIIRMLMSQPKPKILFMDEATASLDIDNRNKVLEIVRKQLPDSTIFYIDHVPEVLVGGKEIKNPETIQRIREASGICDTESFCDATISFNMDSGQFIINDLQKEKSGNLSRQHDSTQPVSSVSSKLKETTISSLDCIPMKQHPGNLPVGNSGKFN